LLGYDDGPFEGFAWKRIEKPEATVAEGAYVGHSVGGYAEGGAYGPYSHQQFLEGKKQVYTLRDKRNRPVNTIEVRIGPYDLPEVTQVKGNGRASGNTAPESYDVAVLDFLQNYIKPVRIGEDDRFLTPILRSYKENLEQTSLQREREARDAADRPNPVNPVNPANAWENVGNNLYLPPAAQNARERLRALADAARARMRARAQGQEPE
jgi:hypothetical protein